MKLYNINEYKVAKEVCEDYPKVMDELRMCREKLRRFRKYVVIDNIIEAIDEAAVKIYENHEYYQGGINGKEK
jgi:hypothetical protein